MTRTVYRVDMGETVKLVTGAATAEAYSRDGHRVTAVTGPL